MKETDYSMYGDILNNLILQNYIEDNIAQT